MKNTMRVKFIGNEYMDLGTRETYQFERAPGVKHHLCGENYLIHFTGRLIEKSEPLQLTGDIRVKKAKVSREHDFVSCHIERSDLFHLGVNDDDTVYLMNDQSFKIPRGKAFSLKYKLNMDLFSGCLGGYITDVTA